MIFDIWALVAGQRRLLSYPCLLSKMCFYIIVWLLSCAMAHNKYIYMRVTIVYLARILWLYFAGLGFRVCVTWRCLHISLYSYTGFCFPGYNGIYCLLLYYKNSLGTVPLVFTAWNCYSFRLVYSSMNVLSLMFAHWQ